MSRLTWRLSAVAYVLNSDTRCFEDGIIELSFEEWAPPYLDMRYAVAIGELDPPHDVHGWEGGYHLESIGPGSMFDAELSPQRGNEVGCG